MSTILDKIAEIEAEMARTQKNKATAGHLGMLKAKLAKLRRELITPKSQGGGTGEGREGGHALIGMPVVHNSVIFLLHYCSRFRGGQDWRRPDRFHR